MPTREGTLPAISASPFSSNPVNTIICPEIKLINFTRNCSIQLVPKTEFKRAGQALRNFFIDL